MRKIFVPGAMIAMLASAAALAAPGASQSALAASPTTPAAHLGTSAAPDTLLVRDDDRGYRYRNDDRDDRRRYRAGHRYNDAPRHWRRYHSRPRDWNTRGCIIVGPVWFCP